MSFALGNLLVAVLLLASMLALQEWGRRLGERHRRLTPDDDESASGATEAAVFGLLGLMLAFTFSGATTRFDIRRQLIVTEANAIGTAWLRIDVLPVDRQAPMRELFRRYLDARLETYRVLPDLRLAQAQMGKAVALQQQIWSAAVAAATASGQVPPYMVFLPALNEMIDIMTTRTAATRIHPPVIVFVMLGLLALVGSVFVGYGLAGRRARSSLHRLGFALVTATALFVIVDLEYPRLGLVRVDAMDQVLVELRASMK